MPISFCKLKNFANTSFFFLKMLKFKFIQYKFFLKLKLLGLFCDRVLLGLFEIMSAFLFIAGVIQICGLWLEEWHSQEICRLVIWVVIINFFCRFAISGLAYLRNLLVCNFRMSPRICRLEICGICGQNWCTPLPYIPAMFFGQLKHINLISNESL